MKLDAFITYALDDLNNLSGGDKMFEELCHNLISQYCDMKYLPASGSAAGGDGGVDGWIDRNGEKIKCAFSIQKENLTGKIKSEIEKWNKKQYSKMYFFSNQVIKQNKKEKLYKFHDRLTIYDRESIKTIIGELPNLGQYIGLPAIKRAFDRELLHGRHQFHDSESTIKAYIPRVLENVEQKHESSNRLDFFDFIKKSMLTIVEAPAGFGKSTFLKKLYISILDSDVDFLPPPIFVHLKDYIRGTLRQQLQTMLPLEIDEGIKSYALLLDGYDEIPEAERPYLIKELNQLSNAPDTWICFVLTARGWQYNYSDFKDFDSEPFKIIRASITDLSSKDTDTLLQQSEIADRQEFLDNDFFRNNSQNVFYVSKLIEFYEKKKSLANNLVILMDFVVDAEINRIFRGKPPSTKDIENIALYMTVNQKLELKKEENNSLSVFNTTVNRSRFAFSHKSIQEYLAARRLSHCTLEEMQKIIAIGKDVIPFLTNTFGFLLNILCEKQPSLELFERLIYWSMEKNSQKLIQIESDKILPTMNHEIFICILEEKLETSTVFIIPNEFFTFMAKNHANIKHIIDALISSSETNDNNLFFYARLVQRITSYERFVHKQHIFQVADNTRLLKFFLGFLSDKPEQAGRLLYSICYNRGLSERNYDQLKSILDTALAFVHIDGVFSNLCITMYNSKKVLKFEDFSRLLKHAVHFHIYPSSEKFASAKIPEQLDDDFKIPHSNISGRAEFYGLSRVFIEQCPENYWKAMAIVNEEIGKSGEPTSHEGMIKFCRELFGKIKIDVAFEYSTFDLKIVMEFLLQQGKFFNADYWLEKILNDCDLKNNTLWEVIIAFIEENLDRTGWHQLLSSLYKKIDSVDDYTYVTERLASNNSSKINKFCGLLEYSVVYNHKICEEIFDTLDDAMKEEVRKDRAEQKKREEANEIMEQKPTNDIEVLFDKQLLKKAVVYMFTSPEKDIISKRDIVERNYFRRDIEVNTFVVSYAWSLLKDKERQLSKEVFVSHIDKINAENNWGVHLADYMSENRISGDIFDKAKKERIFKWIRSTLEKFPMRKAQDCKYIIQQALCYLLQTIEFGGRTLPTEMLIGAAFSGFPQDMRGAFSFDYESLSIDYLESYIQKSDILHFLIEEFDPNAMSKLQIIACCGYMAANINDIAAYQKEEIKKKIITYLDRNMDKNYDTSVRILMFKVGAKLEDLSREKLITSFITEHDRSENYASSFLRDIIPENENINNTYLVDLLKEAFNMSEGMRKVKIAEHIIVRERYAGDVFEYYANYVLESNTNKISSSFVYGGFNGVLFTSDITHLPLLERLYMYALEKQSTRREIIGNLALRSYQEIATAVEDRHDLDRVLDSIKEVSQKSGNSSIIYYADEIEAAYVDRSYKSPPWKEIVKLSYHNSHN